MEVQQQRIRTSKEKDSRYWFRCNEKDQIFILSKMKKNDVADYFRGCHEKLFKALKKKDQPKRPKNLPRSRVRTPKTKAKK